MGYLPSVLFFGIVLPLQTALAYKLTYRVCALMCRRFYRWRLRIKDYWKYQHPYNVAIFAHLLVLAATKLFGKRAARYVYTRVF